MSRFKKLICLCLALSVFAIFAMGSGSEDKKDTNAPTNQNANTNQNQGTVAPAVTTTAAPVANYEVGEAKVTTKVDSIKTTWVYVSIPIKNTGDTNLYLSTCSVDIENSAGALQQVMKRVGAYPQVLKPGEIGYYYDGTTYDGTETEGLKAVPHVDIKPAKVDCVRLAVSELQLKEEEYGGVGVMGRVENTTDKDQTLVHLVAFLYGEKDELLRVETSLLTDTVVKGDKIGFEISGLLNDLKASDITRFEVYVYPTQYQF